MAQPKTDEPLPQAAFNLEQALIHMGGDHELFQELVFVFLEESSRQIDEIRAASTERNARIVERAAHSIKGSVGTFAAKRAMEAARALEHLGREEKIASFPQAISALEEELDLLKDALLIATRSM